MKYRLIVLAVACVLLAAWTMSGVAQEAAKKPVKPQYVGADKCKTCHKSEHGSWLTTKHAKAYEALKPEDRKKDSCAVCHVTGQGVADSLFAGVQCEACHGPGSLYKAMTIMSPAKYKADRAAQHKLALEAGLVIPNKDVCVKCHNAKSPTFKGFDYEKALIQGVHAHKAAGGEAKPSGEPKKEEPPKKEG